MMHAELHGKAFPVSKCLVIAVAAAAATVAIIECIIHVVSAPSITPMPASRHHCQSIKTSTKTLPTSKTPPWSFNGTTKPAEVLYVWPQNAGSYRLGNRLFNYASTFGVAWRNRHRPVMPDTETAALKQYDLANIFNVRMHVDRGNRITKSRETQAIHLKEAGSAMHDNRFEQLPARNVSLRNFLQSYKYFRHVEDQLRVDLTFRPPVIDTARRWLEKWTPPTEWRSEQFVRVLIHVRRSDYADPYHERDGWPTPTGDYFRRAMTYFTDCLERVLFVVLSDDPAWCRKYVHASNVVYSSGNSAAVDMAIASLCDHAIITVGSYGWWAAWFANGITITQKNLPKNGSRLAKRLCRDDYYKPEWIGL